MIPGIIFLIIVFSFVLIKAADLVIVAIRRITKGTKAKAFTISAIILAIGTSLPELSVGITSALEGNPSISLGDITGSNIANIALVAGLTSVFVGKVGVYGKYMRREVGTALVAGALPIALLFDKSLSRVDGLILLAIYAAYASHFFRHRFEQIAEEQEQENFVWRFSRRFNHIAQRRKQEVGKLFVGIALMLFSADAIVRLARFLAESFDIPTFLIGLVVVAIGTSLPEFAFSFRSLEEHEPSMFFGNLLGSTIANSTLVIGIVAVIHPIEVVAVNEYFLAVATFFLVFIVFWRFISSKNRLDRWEGGVLLLLYVVFLILEFV